MERWRIPHCSCSPPCLFCVLVFTIAKWMNLFNHITSFESKESENRSEKRWRKPFCNQQRKHMDRSGLREGKGWKRIFSSSKDSKAEKVRKKEKFFEHLWVHNPVSEGIKKGIQKGMRRCSINLQLFLLLNLFPPGYNPASRIMTQKSNLLHFPSVLRRWFINWW